MNNQILSSSKDDSLERIKNTIRNIPDFPSKGILFRDITPLLANGPLFNKAVDLLVEGYSEENIDAIAGIETRGCIFASAAAYKLKLPFIPIRKKNKLPWKTFEENYNLEYGSNTLSIHQDAFAKGQRVLLMDDLLATGGSAVAAVNLIKRCGAELVGCSFLIELLFCKGREKLTGLNTRILIQY